MTNPFIAPWVGWEDDKKKSSDSGNPFLDQLDKIIHDQIHGAIHEPFTKALSQNLVDGMVAQGMMDKSTGKQILPAVEFVVGKIDPCG